MDNRRHSQIVKERVVRHNRLMKLIKGYNLSSEQTKKLQRIKLNTMMEINMRYLKSDHNRYYKFPKAQVVSSSDEQEDIFDHFISKKQNIVYDLRTQNEVLPAKSSSHKGLSLDNSRKITSLDFDKNNYQRQRILRYNFKESKQVSNKLLSRKNSGYDRIKRQVSRLKLPQLKIEKIKQNLKTEGKIYEDQNQLHPIIGKKLVTQSSESPTKMKGVERYLKNIETKQKQNGLKSNFRRRIFFPDKLH